MMQSSAANQMETVETTATSALGRARTGTLELAELMDTAERLKGAGQKEEALALYREWLDHSPSPFRFVAYFNYGVLLAAEEKFAPAEQMYRTALELKPDLIQAQLNLGVCLAQQGRQDEAIAQLRTALTRDGMQDPQNLPLRLTTLNTLAILHNAANNPGEALAALEQSRSLDPSQPTINALWENLTHRAAPPAATEEELAKLPEPVIYVLACCYNEAAILPFFLDYYTNYVGATKIFLYDGGSDDGSDLIVKDYPVEFIVEKHDKLDDSVLMRIRNEEWKKHRTECDWFIVCDVDEFLYHPDLRNKLKLFKRDGITLPLVEGSEMISKTFPKFRKGAYLPDLITSGSPNPAFYNKNLIFDTRIDINYTMGCHHCVPTGNVVRSSRAEFKNLHYKLLSLEYLTMKARKSNDRLSDWNKQHGAGIHYQWLAQQKREEFLQQFQAIENVLSPVPRPAICRDGFLPAFDILLNRDNDPVMLEFDTQRCYGDSPDGGGSTHLFSWFINRYDGEFYSVDADRTNVENGMRELKRRKLLGEHVQLVAEEPSRFLKKFGKSIDFLSLNAREYRGNEKDLREAQQRLLSLFKAAEKSMASDAVILIDGVNDAASYEGCAKLLIPYLLEKGYRAVHTTYQFILHREAKAK